LIVTEQKSMEEILKSLSGKKKVFLAGCAVCATICKTGGEPEVLQMKENLEREGKEVVGWVVIDTPCNTAAVKRDLAKHRKEVKEAEAILLFSCGGGVQTVKEQGRIDVPVCAGCNSLFLGTIGPDGNYYEECSLCGECILDKTGGVCPVTRCAKGLLNGPCGGSIEGKCEVDREQDCAWLLIYKELEKKGELDRLKEYQAPKNYDKMRRPHRKIMTPASTERGESK
jgi:hypothetical protein